MKRYSSYKDSGVEWIGEIPSGWRISKLKFESTIIGRIGYRGYTTNDIVDEGFGVITLSPSNITKDQKLNLNNSTYLSWEKYKESPEIQIFNGDIILVKTSSIGKVSIIENVNQELTLNPQLIVLKEIKQENKFLYYCLISDIIQYQLEISKSGGVTPTITQETINSFNTPLPPLSEQQQIVSYLDEKISLVDTLIQSKQKKISLLKEKRTSLINQLVTKGLNPDVEMKDSGVEWIGEIPMSWASPKLGFYTIKIGSGSTPRGGSEIYVESGVPFIRSQNVHFSGLDLSDVTFITPEIHYSMSGTTVRKSDVLLNITGGSIGRCCLVDTDEEMNVNQHVSIIRTKNSLNPYLLNYILSSDIGQKQVEYNISGGNREGLTIDGISNFYIPIPSKTEQQQIVEFLDKETSLIDKTVSIEERKIELLKEYKQSLISEVVTGKRKVVSDE